MTFDRNSIGTFLPDTLDAELWYPRMEDRPDEVRVSLVDVRAASALVIRYDFDRDGWAIYMDRHVEHEGWMETVEENVEVAFVPAWFTDPKPAPSPDEPF